MGTYLLVRINRLHEKTTIFNIDCLKNYKQNVPIRRMQSSSGQFNEEMVLKVDIFLGGWAAGSSAGTWAKFGNIVLVCLYFL